MKKLLFFCRLAWKESPSYILLLAIQALAAAGKLWINVILPKFLVEELVGGKDAGTLCMLGGLIVLNNVGMAWLEKLLARFLEVKKTYVRQAMRRQMAEKIMHLEYACLEDPYYLDLKERAAFAISNQDAIAQLIQCISGDPGDAGTGAADRAESEHRRNAAAGPQDVKIHCVYLPGDRAHQPQIQLLSGSADGKAIPEGYTALRYGRDDHGAGGSVYPRYLRSL